MKNCPAISLLLSSHQDVRLLAFVILIGFGVAYLSFHQAYISLWCFLAALVEPRRFSLAHNKCHQIKRGLFR